MDCPQACSDGLVQAVRQCYKKAVKILNYSGFVNGNVYPCLYVKKSAKSVVYVFIVGDMVAIDDAIAALNSNGLVLKIMEGLQDYLSCKIKSERIKGRLGWDSPI